MKVKKLQKYGNKSGLMGCRWSSLNAPDTENPLYHPILGLHEFPFPFLAISRRQNQTAFRSAAAGQWSPITDERKFIRETNNLSFVRLG